jgi:hypothetical protein
MAPVVPLEPLRNAVLALGGAVLVLAIFLLLERSLALLAMTRAARREPVLTRAIYDALQSWRASASGNSPSGGESGLSGSICGEISPGAPWNVAA